MMSETNGWDEWRRHVLAELERLNGTIANQQSKINRICSDIAALKVKATVWGLVGGSVPVVIMLAIQILKGH